jgi:hypothetical protein
MQATKYKDLVVLLILLDEVELRSTASVKIIDPGTMVKA